MKNLRMCVLVSLAVVCLTGLAEATYYYSRPMYRYYQPVTYYQEVVEEAPVCVAQPIYVRRAHPVRVYRHRGCSRPFGHMRHPFFGGFSFSIGF